MTDLEYFKLSKPEKMLRSVGGFFARLPKGIWNGIKKLGLFIAAIVKGIADAHGAGYGVESEEGKGSTFWLELKETHEG